MIRLSSFNRTSFQQQLKLSIDFTVVNNLFSFNRTSFQQQLKQTNEDMNCKRCKASIVHPFNNNWNPIAPPTEPRKLASIVHPFNNNWNTISLSFNFLCFSFNRTSFQQQLKPIEEKLNDYVGMLQSYILSTTTETGLTNRDLYPNI